MSMAVRAVSHSLRLRSGHSIPQLGFGTYRLSDADAPEAVRYAIECGFRHIDCAKVYGNQRAVGEGIRAAVGAGLVKRDELFVTSKLWMTQYRPEDVAAACKETLHELSLDYLDLYLMHWPVAWRRTSSWDAAGAYPKNADGGADEADIPLSDTWAALEEVADQGLVNSLGVSNFSVEQIKGLQARRHAVALNQIELHPLLKQSSLVSALRAEGIVTAAYCPLAMPTRFTPTEYKGLCDPNGQLQGLSEFTGYSLARVLLSWNVDRGNVVLCKATSRKHIEDNSRVCRYNISKAIAYTLSEYEEVAGSTRVVHPTDFRRVRGPFFRD